MAIKIRARYEGFRRCGLSHHLEPTVHPDGRFTDEEMEILQAEPMLTVELTPETPVDPEKMTVEQLRNALRDAPSGTLKPGLVTLYQEQFPGKTEQSG